jgi:signal transduction histidine kinase
MLIEGDRDQLGQVIVNLVLNAVDAMDHKGTLTLRTYPDKAAQKACIEVSDMGRGIPKENLSLIFDPFFTTKAPGKGTGLGLSTAYGIIKENNGRIWVKETSEKGTTFAVEFPFYLPSNPGNNQS